jgi:hypothetical protein
VRQRSSSGAEIRISIWRKRAFPSALLKTSATATMMLATSKAGVKWGLQSGSVIMTVTGFDPAGACAVRVTCNESDGARESKRHRRPRRDKYGQKHQCDEMAADHVAGLRKEIVRKAEKKYAASTK